MGPGQGCMVPEQTDPAHLDRPPPALCSHLCTPAVSGAGTLLSQGARRRQQDEGHSPGPHRQASILHLHTAGRAACSGGLRPATLLALYGVTSPFLVPRTPATFLNQRPMLWASPRSGPGGHTRTMNPKHLRWERGPLSPSHGWGDPGRRGELAEGCTANRGWWWGGRGSENLSGFQRECHSPPVRPPGGVLPRSLPNR